MSIVHRIAKNTSVLLIAQAISYLLSLFYLMYATRYLGPANYGIITFGIAFIAIFATLADFGLTTITVRDVSRDKELAAKYVINLGVTKILLSIITYGLLALTINIGGYQAETVNVVYILGIYIFFANLNQLFNALFQAWERMELQAIGQVLTAVFMLLGVLIVVQFKLSLLHYAALIVMVNLFTLLSNLIIIILIQRSIGIKIENILWQIDWRFCQSILVNAWVLSILPVISQVYFRLDILLLKALKGDADVGLYTAAHGLIEYCTIAPAMLLAAMFPIMCRFYQNESKSLELAIGKSIKYLFILVLPLCLLIMLLADPIVFMVYGDKFAESVQILRILIWATVFMYVNWVITTTYVATNKQNLYIILIIVILALNFSLNLLLIPLLSYMGAAISKVATEALYPVIGMIILYKLGYRLNLKEIYVAPLIGFIVSGIAVLLLVSINTDKYIVAAIAMIIYSVIVYKIAIKDDDKQLVKSLFRKSRA